MELSEYGNLGKRGEIISDFIVVSDQNILGRFPDILKSGEWFEEIPEKPKMVGDLKEGDECWIICSEGSRKIRWNFVNYGAARDLGDIVLTQKEAEKELARRRARVILERDTKGFKPDWEDCNFGYSILYDVMLPSPKLVSSWAECVDGTIRFANEKDAQESIKKHEKEWKIYLGVEE